MSERWTAKDWISHGIVTALEAWLAIWVVMAIRDLRARTDDLAARERDEERGRTRVEHHEAALAGGIPAEKRVEGPLVTIECGNGQHVLVRGAAVHDGDACLVITAGRENRPDVDGHPAAPGENTEDKVEEAKDR